MPSKAQRITGWVFTGLVGLFLIGASGVLKFFDFPGKNEMMEKLGIPLALLLTLAVLEIGVALLYLIPRHIVYGSHPADGIAGGSRLHSPARRRTVVLSGHRGRLRLGRIDAEKGGNFLAAERIRSPGALNAHRGGVENRIT